MSAVETREGPDGHLWLYGRSQTPRIDWKLDVTELKIDYHRCREALERIAHLEDEYREAGLPYDLDTGAQIALRRAGDIAREGLGLPPRVSAYDPPLGRGKT